MDAAAGLRPARSLATGRSGSIAKFLYDAADIFFSSTLVGLEATLPKIGVLSACIVRGFCQVEVLLLPTKFAISASPPTGG